MYFVSKKDITYFLVIWGTIAISSSIVIIPIIYATSIFHLLWVLLGLLIIAFFIWLWFGSGYKIENGTIKIEHGPIKDTIKIQDIKRISKKKSFLAAASLAIDRLELRYGRYGSVFVSPKKEYEFIRLLLSKSPEIQMDKELSKMYKL